MYPHHKESKDMPEFLSAIKTIRKHCVDCSGGSFAEVERCPVTSCILWPWRFGKDPRRTGKRVASPAQIEHAKTLHKYKGKNADTSEGCETMPSASE